MVKLKHNISYFLNRYEYTILLISISLAILFIWFIDAKFYIIEKAALFDDAFILLHTARNTIELGTAKYFPIDSANEALLTSSILRFLVLLPGEWLIANVFDLPRSEEAARYSLYLSGITTCLLFLPFYKGRLLVYLVGVLISGLLAATTETALQMEGLLIFWCTYILAADYITGTTLTPTLLRRAGLLISLLALARIEYGLAGGILALGLVVWDKKRGALPYVWALLMPAVVLAVVWILTAAMLGVYPIPTTFYSKVLQSNVRFSGSTFLDEFGSRFFAYFAASSARVDETVSLLLGACFLLGLMAAFRKRAIVLLLVPIMVFVIIAQSSGWYLWYFENFVILLFAIVVALAVSLIAVHTQSIRTSRRQSWPILFTIIALLLPATFVFHNYKNNRIMPWNFKPELVGQRMSRAVAYTNLAKHHLGNGLFDIIDGDPVRINVAEIGIIAYLSGPTVWMGDAFGLAQPGHLELVTHSSLSVFYPDRVLVTIDRAFERVKWDRPVETVFFWGKDNDSPIECAFVRDDQGFCVQQFNGDWRQFLQRHIAAVKTAP